MNTEQQNLPLRKISSVFANISFVADLITIALFIRDLFQEGAAIHFEEALAQVSIILAIFVLAILLLLYSREKYKSSILDWIVWIFGWLYIILAALIFAVISFRFIINADYRLGEFIGYNLLIALIAGLGYSVASLIQEHMILAPTEEHALANYQETHGYFAIPFMLVALEQIVLWVTLIFTRRTLTFFSWTFIGNLLIFAYAGSFILFLIGFEKFKEITIRGIRIVISILKSRVKIKS